MAEYIKKKDLVEFACRHVDGKLDANDIARFPTADVVEVVRCRDCKYFETDEEDELGECKCGYIAVSYNGALYPHRTDYCSYGERQGNK